MASQKLPCLFIVCDNAVLRTGYQSLLSRSARLRLVGQGDHQTSLEDVRETGANVVAIDASTADRRGFRTAERFRNDDSDLCIFLISVDGLISEQHARIAGADGHISLTDELTDDELVTAVIDGFNQLPDSESPDDSPPSTG